MTRHLYHRHRINTRHSEHLCKHRKTCTEKKRRTNQYLNHLPLICFVFNSRWTGKTKSENIQILSRVRTLKNRSQTCDIYRYIPIETSIEMRRKYAHDRTKAPAFIKKKDNDLYVSIILHTELLIDAYFYDFFSRENGKFEFSRAYGPREQRWKKFRDCEKSFCSVQSWITNKDEILESVNCRHSSEFLFCF